MKNQNITPHTQFRFRFNQNNLRIENLNASYSYALLLSCLLWRENNFRSQGKEKKESTYAS